MGLTTTKSERFSVCANRGQSHMCRATASAPVSLSPALRAAPSRWEGGSFCLRIYLAYLLPDAILVSSAEVLLHEGAFERLEQRRAPLDAFLLTIDFVNEVREFGLERERGQFDFKPLQSCY